MKALMKRMGRLVVALLLAACLALSSCSPVSGPSDGGTTTDTQSTETLGKDEAPNYTVTLSDHFGNPMPAIVVKLMQGEEMAAMSVTDSRGVASFKYNTGEYTVELDFAGGESEAAQYSYDLEGVKLNEQTPAATVTLYKSITDFERILKGTQYYDVGKISDGAYRVELAEEGTTYFIFRPTRSGIYEFGFVSGTKIEIGYYGDPINVTDHSLVEVVNNKFRLEIRSMYIGATEETTTPYIIGLTPRSAKNCILTVERIGEPEKSPAEDTWKAIHATEKYLVQPAPVSGTFTPLDLKAADLKVVLNENDGYYHLGTADGPVVYVLISEKSTHADQLPSFIEQLGTGTLGVYFYDGEGNYLYKEHYNEMFTEYSAVCNTNGACPMTEELATAIRNLGNYRGWWSFPEQDIFGDNLVPVENAWLFACGYYK